VRGPALILLASLSIGCISRPAANPNIIVVGVPSGPTNLDPRIGTDDTSQKAGQLIFSSLMTLDDQLRIVPQLAERLDNPSPTTYEVTLRRGVRFHDGHELTSADVVHTFRSMLGTEFVSPIKGAFGLSKAVDARDRYTVVFTLTEPFGSFPANLVVPPIVPEGADASFREHPIGTGPYRFVRYAVDDQLELAAFENYYEGRPRNDGIILKVVPDDIMRGLELRKGTMDLDVNDLAPDIVNQLRREPGLQMVQSPGTDYQYVGLNLRDPFLRDLRVRRALAYAIDYDAIVQYLRRGLATTAA
jgi:ABC-type transport system substrate-binding protein